MRNSKFHLYSVAVSVIITGTSNSAYAEFLTITEFGQKNLGSTAAYSLTCEKESLSPVGGANQILKAANSSLAPKDALAVRRQFQISTHEKKIFSPSRNEWFDFVIDKQNCDEITKTIPIILDAMKPR